MARERVELHNILKRICPNVYFQPPANISMVYPCLVYTRARGHSDYADNSVYNHLREYEIKLISTKVDDPMYDQLLALPLCSHDRFYTADTLNHDVFTIFF